MEKKIIVLVACINTILIHASIKIFEDSPRFDNSGYYNTNIYTNGERLMIHSFIKDNDVVFDVGANVGNWSLAVLKEKKVDPIYAFEPIPQVFNKLKKNLHFSNTTLFNYALTDQSHKRPFIYYQQGEGSASSFYIRPNIQHTHSPRTIEVETKTLDSFCNEHNIHHIDFLKIDTEGAEFEVLRGATNLLKEKKIGAIQFEYGGTYPDAGIKFEDVFNFIHNFGYTLFRILPNGILHFPTWKNKLENGRYSNYLALSPKKYSELINE